MIARASLDAGHQRLLMVGGVRRVFGDATEADLMWTDPPYGVAYQTKLSTEEAVARHRRTDCLEVTNDQPEDIPALLAAAFGHAPLRAVEAKHLDGHPALFPATIRDWAEQLERIATLAGLAERLAELDGLDPSALEDPEAGAKRVDQLVRDLVEPARVKALDDMGEGRRAIAIAMRWLEPRLSGDP